MSEDLTDPAGDSCGNAMDASPVTTEKASPTGECQQSI